MDASPTPSASPNLATAPQTLANQVQKLGLGQIQRHLFLCSTPTKPLCCNPEAGLVAWTYLKQRLVELNLARPSADRPTCIYRTKADCLQVCQQGPILLVYPDGIWYHSVTPPVIERILQEHILGDQIVEDFLFCRSPLPTPANLATSP